MSEDRSIWIKDRFEHITMVTRVPRRRAAVLPGGPAALQEIGDTDHYGFTANAGRYYMAAISGTDHNGFAEVSENRDMLRGTPGGRMGFYR